ncbi:MAG: hypothetical protein H6738_23305 [Alphaproteobacteria bacterium]|nr:hypothetical protein [Alphaproteobacteria bacterium]MCB9699733.1 hypothetical protein [Alphaproteobacteria bacterium]
MKRRVLVRACSLALLSAASAAAWRAEVEWHGWGGLGYTHLAVPIASAAFIAWTCTTAELPNRRRALLAAMLTAYASVLGPVVHQILAMTEAGWPSAMFLYLSLTELFGTLERGLVALWTVRWLVLAAVPAGTSVLARVAGVAVHPGHAALGLALFQLSWPIATWLLAVTGHVGGATTVNAVKSGFVVPLLVVGLGLPFVRPGPPRWRPLLSSGAADGSP